MFCYVSAQMREIVIEMSCPRSCRWELNPACRPASDSDANTAAIPCCPRALPHAPARPPFRLLLPDECQNVFQGVTLSRVLSVCLCERD